MGTFRVTLEVGDPQGQRYETVEALVDTGASYTLLPATLLRRLGIQVIGQWRFRTAEERVVEYDIGEAIIRLDGAKRTRVVVFGPGDNALVGADTLEGFGLAVDPMGKRLIRVPGLLM
jgi:clan AA aspartic protease